MHSGQDRDQGSGRPRAGAGGRNGGSPRGSDSRPRGGAARAGGAAGSHQGRPPRGARPDVDRSSRSDTPAPPAVPDGVEASDLDRSARGRLRTLSRENADGVAKHLVMAGRLIDEDPELAYQHAQAAVRRAGRVDVVREAAAITAYRTGRYAEALRELRTVRRLNGSDEHLPLMADCERGLGRPDRALALAQEDGARTLPDGLKAELAIVVSGARLDLDDADAALAVLSPYATSALDPDLAARVAEARAAALSAAGRETEAVQVLAEAGVPDAGQGLEVVVFDLDEREDEGVPAGDHSDSASEARRSGTVGH